jgi:hypothetical protein
VSVLGQAFIEIVQDAGKFATTLKKDVTEQVDKAAETSGGAYPAGRRAARHPWSTASSVTFVVEQMSRLTGAVTVVSQALAARPLGDLGTAACPALDRDGTSGFGLPTVSANSSAVPLSTAVMIRTGSPNVR